MSDKSEKIKVALESQRKSGVHFMKSNEPIILEQLKAGYSAAAIYKAFVAIGDAPPIKLRTFEYHLKKLRPLIKNKANSPTPIIKSQQKKSLTWDATDTGKEID